MTPNMAPVYTPTFDFVRFYCVPRQWLAEIANAFDLDTRDLVLAMSRADEPTSEPLIYFDRAETQHESYWTREEGACGLPYLVNKTTYKQYKDLLEARGWIKPRDKRGQYDLLGWPAFDDQGFIFRPREYVLNRWPVVLGRNNWPARLALLGLMGQMTVDCFNAQGVIATRAAFKQVGEQIEQLCHTGPWQAHAPAIAQALDALVSMGVVSRLKDKGSTQYELRSDAFARCLEWPIEEIAARCGLKLPDELALAELVQSFLRANLWPVSKASEVLRTVRKRGYAAAFSDGDPHEIVVELEKRVNGGGHSSRVVGVDKVMDWYVNKELPSRLKWRQGDEFSLSTDEPLGAEQYMPATSTDALQATQLEITFKRSGRAGVIEALERCQGLQLYLVQPRQGDARMLIDLKLPELNEDRLLGGLRLDCNRLHKLALNWHEPCAVWLMAPRPISGITLSCRWRCRL